MAVYIAKRIVIGGKMQFSIRNANINDIDKIAEIHSSCWKNSYKDIIAQNYLDSMNIEKSVSRNLLNLKRMQDDEFFLVAVNQEDEVLGYCIGGNQRDSEYSEKGEVAALYIDLDYQQQGIGTALLNKAFDKLREKALNSVLIWALMKNRQKDFYLKNGGKSKYVLSYKIGEQYYLLEGWKWEL